MSLEYAVDKYARRPRRSKRFVTVSELSDLFGWSRRTTYRRIRDGMIEPPVKVGLRLNGWTVEYVDGLLVQAVAGEAPWQVDEAA